MLMCYITSRRQFPGRPEDQRRLLLEKIQECGAAGVDYIQLREKDLNTRALEALAAEAAALVPQGGPARLLINSRIDVALACGIHGVHLPANDLTASEARALLARGGSMDPVIGVSVHSVEELSYAEAHGADLALFAPVFEKDGRTAGDGITKLAQACNKPDRDMPVLALGGVTLENARQCMRAGADGIAAIRLFQENNVASTVERLRQMVFS